MDYEKAYKKALERAKSEWVNNLDNAYKNYRERLGIIFPELVESEDERIRKELISFVNNDGWKFTKLTKEEKESWIDWLEKQAPKAIHEEKVDNANKVEPKFKVGDWCIDNEDGVIFQIVKVLDNTYTYKTNEGKEYYCTHYSLENDARLWTVKDAKDGDILVHNDCTFIFMGIKDGIVQAIEENILEPVSFGKPDEDNDYHPATKEQRELLFQKMHEAGWEWDSDKKELKKIEDEEYNGEDYGKQI